MFIGFWRSFKVREDVLRSSIGLEVQKVVEACNTYWLGKTKAAKSYERVALRDCHKINVSLYFSAPTLPA